MTSTPNFQFVTTMADTDAVMVNVGGKTRQILFSDFKKLIGSTGASTGSTGTTGSTNLFSTPKEMGQSTSTKFFEYQPNGELTRPGGLRLVVKSPYTGPVLMTEEMPNTKLVPGSVYTLGFNFVRAANTGTGQPYAHCDWHQNNGIPDAESALISAVTDGQSYRVALPFKVPTGVADGFPGVRFSGSCDVTLSNVTLVAGSTDNPNAV